MMAQNSKLSGFTGQHGALSNWMHRSPIRGLSGVKPDSCIFLYGGLGLQSG
jgi:hypothetical protein